MKTLFAALAFSCLAGTAIAQTATPAMPATPASPAMGKSCTIEATDKKLAGAAKTSFLTKCEKDATAACDKAAMDKKLAGAAKTSFTKKCVTDAVGT